MQKKTPIGDLQHALLGTGGPNFSQDAIIFFSRLSYPGPRTEFILTETVSLKLIGEKKRPIRGKPVASFSVDVQPRHHGERLYLLRWTPIPTSRNYPYPTQNVPEIGKTDKPIGWLLSNWSWKHLPKEMFLGCCRTKNKKSYNMLQMDQFSRPNSPKGP